DFDPTVAMDRKEARRNDRFVQFAVAAAREAVEHAGLGINAGNSDQIGVIIGSGIGGIGTLSEQLEVLREKGPRRVSPFLVPMMISDMASGQVSIVLGARGPNVCTVSACSSGADAVGYSFEVIRRGDAIAMIAGGAEAAVTPIGVAGFASARALSTRNDDPGGASRPFDAGRDGFVLGEGSAILVLESLDHALARGAPILAELAGYGMTADAHHITQPAEGGEGGVRAMRHALSQAGVCAEEVDYVNAHGTSTPMNDKFETQAIKTVFGEHAYEMPISSIKSMVGHLLGAAGALEACVCVQTIQSGIIPPTINFTTADPECDLDYTPNTARQIPVKTVLSNSFGFGGHNSSLLFVEYLP
ncbi:MAG TPA: beta-ketoacyl-ACP synthase II, partial [Dehalococcoidia bacterium]|nr:beta-ketoacyl-ACP synthase II [Dehalococcoidia bacterium]